MTGERARVAVVDDVEMQRRVLGGMLGKEFAVATYGDGLAFLQHAGECDLVLLDIDLAGTNGYDICRRLRAQPGTQELPVIFVSGHDTSPERVAAYEAGGDDFVIKPVVASELLHKVRRLLEYRRTRGADEAPDARATADAGALGVSLNFLRRCMACQEVMAVADFLIEAVRELGLHGAVQIRTADGVVERSALPAAGSLQSSVMASMRDMGRVFVFGSRGIINHDDVSLLVTGLPAQDKARAERLRDDLCVLVEGAAARVLSIAATERGNRLIASAGRTLGLLEQTLSDAMSKTRAARRRGQQQTMEMLDTLGRLIEGLDLTDLQRENLQHTIEDGVEALANINEEVAIADDQFAQVINSLKRMAAGTAARGDRPKGGNA